VRAPGPNGEDDPMSEPAADLAASARQIRYEWLQASLTWTDHTATDFHDRCWGDLERAADQVASEAAVLEEALERARRAMEW
jgi:hypothetical protein